jgi:hypothetical protein
LRAATALSRANAKTGRAVARGSSNVRMVPDEQAPIAGGGVGKAEKRWWCSACVFNVCSFVIQQIITTPQRRVRSGGS